MKKHVRTEKRVPTGHAADCAQTSTLTKGQIWKAGENYVLIGDTGKRLIQYRVTKKLDQRGLRIQMASVESVRAFLNAQRAELMVTS